MSFEEFWKVYPRRIAKFAARKAWDKALKHNQEHEILEGAKRYAVEREDENPKFTKHPSTWLNGGCWMDDPGANGGHEKSYAELADDLRHDDTGSSNSESDLFGATISTRSRYNGHH